MENLTSLLLVAFVSLIAAISPGPDFFIVVRNNLTYSRKIGFWTSFGVAIALIIHLSYTIVGIGVLMNDSSWTFHALKYVGASYLFYLGISGIISSFKSNAMHLDYAKEKNQISSFQGFKQGFLTNALNPKAALFFVSLFSQFITEDTTSLMRFAYAFINWSVTLSWFLFLSFLISSDFLRSRIDRFRTTVDRVMGGFLILLSLKMIV